MFNLLNKKIHNEPQLSLRVQEDLDKLLDVGFIYTIETFIGYPL
jgi:hypothetical protein